MKKRIFISVLFVVGFSLILSSALYIYKKNKDNYYNKVINDINMIYTKKKNIKNENKYIFNLYNFFMENNNLKSDISDYKYESFISNNSLIEIYNENNNILTNLENNINNLNIKKDEINNKFTMKNFKKLLDQDKNIILDKFNNRIFESNKKEIEDFVKLELIKYNELKEFINNINSNKNKWNKNNDNIITENDEYKNYLEKNNSKFEITITVKKRVVIANHPVSIFMYHAVNDETWGINSLFQKIKDFENEMEYLNDNGYKTIFLSDIKNYLDQKKIVILTFDDGYEDFYRIAYPIMKKYNIKSNLFVISSAVGDKYISAEQIKELSESGLVEIGSHTVNHPNLTTLNDDKLTNELKNSKSYLENLINKRIVTFAYPVGYNNVKVVNEVRKYYDYALLMGGGINYINDNTNYLKLKRISMYRGAPLNYFISKLR